MNLFHDPTIYADSSSAARNDESKVMFDFFRWLLLGISIAEYKRMQKRQKIKTKDKKQKLLEDRLHKAKEERSKNFSISIMGKKIAEESSSFSSDSEDEELEEENNSDNNVGRRHKLCVLLLTIMFRFP